MNQNETFKQLLENNLKQKNKQVIENYFLLNFVNNFQVYDKIDEYRLVPYRINIEPTSRCFLNCKYCQVPIWERKKLPDMTFETFTKIVLDNPHILEINLQGQGEPLLNESFFDMIEFGTKNSIIMRTYTNGVMLNNERANKIINSGLFELRISLDGAKKETVEKLRINLDYDQLMDNIRQLISIRGRKKYPLVNFWMLANNENFNEIVEIVELAHSLGLDGVKIQTKIMYKKELNNLENIQHNSVNLYEENIKELIETASKLARFYNLEFEILHSTYSVDKICYSVINSSFISVDGFVTPCCKIVDPNELNFGNIYENSLISIFMSDEYCAFRKKVISCELNHDDDICSQCFTKY